ncbi:LysR family transcriptional regulator [Catenovulum sp. SM1970]|uniref:LysR family transcriptional regulator n=1 Tax=Marinifaba aquimaris TaxID=2741323 RepID=UPI001572D30E|nr:LysR family transcriptional regulator [Marinifaba aquimaris]NTS78034.1 LysR family transcriptional regulator [Marinifaba aquimaris]
MNGSTYNQIRIFNMIAKEGSISGAARILEMKTPSVSQALKVLENQLGLPLFTRTTRKIELTEAGQLLFENTAQPLQTLSLAFESVSDLNHTPSGKVRITMPRFVYQYILAPIYAEFCQRYPEIELEISLFDGTVDIIEQGFDLGIRFGDRIAEGMVARPLTPSKKDALFASPTYLAQYGMPTNITDLQSHKFIYYRFITSNRLLPLILQDGDNPVHVDMKTALTVNDTELMKDAALRGLGIGRLLESMVEKEFESGELVPILPEAWSPVAGLFIYFHQHTQKAKRVRVLIDFLIEKTQ